MQFYNVGDPVANMMNAQARIISDLRKENEGLHVENRRLNYEVKNHKYNKAAEFYLQLQAAIKTDHNLQQEWKRFIAILMLFLENREPGLTSSLFPEDVVSETE